jgi:hypothetical protein
MELHAVKCFYTQREGLVELEDDVLSIVRQVRDLYGNRVKVNWEPTTGHYVFVESSEDGTDRLIFTTPELDGRALDRLIASDSRARGYEDAYDKAERDQDQVQAAIDKDHMQQVTDVGEQLHWVFHSGGRIFVPRSVDA